MLDFIIMTILCLPYVALQDFKDKGIKCLKNDLIFKYKLFYCLIFIENFNRKI